MRLTKTTDFALRLLIYLAATKNQPETMPRLAEKLKIPYNNLSKLVQALHKREIIQTQQGKNGGIRLMRPAEQITLKDVIEGVEGPTHFSDCLNDETFCSMNNLCKLKGVFHDVQMQINHIFEQVKITSML